MIYLKWVQEFQLKMSVESVLPFSHNIYINEDHQEFSPSCHVAEEAEFALQLAIFLFCLMMEMKKFSIKFGILGYSKNLVILYVIKQNANLMWYCSHKRHALQELTVSAHHRVTALSF